MMRLQITYANLPIPSATVECISTRHPKCSPLKSGCPEPILYTCAFSSCSVPSEVYGYSRMIRRRILLEKLRFDFCALIILLAVLLPATAGAQVSIVTERYDNARTGANLTEAILNTSNVNVSQFGKLFSYTVDGSIQAQPLYVPNVPVAGQGTHNVLYVVTMNDVLYAFDADSNSPNGGMLWSVDFRNPGAGVTAIPITDIVGVNNLNIVGNVGIESTPVIDLSSSTLYLVARTMEVSGSTTNYIARLHAIDITNGSEKFGGPVAV